MRKILAALCLLVYMATPAQAEHGLAGDFYIDDGYLQGDRWNDTITENYCYEGFEPLSDSQETKMSSTLTNQVNSEWEARTDISTNWVNAGQCANTYGFNDWFNGNHSTSCSDIYTYLPPIASRVDYDNLSSPDLGQTLTCDFDNNGLTDFFWIVINDCPHRESCSITWHWNYADDLPEGQYDFAGLFTHEMGHATGFDGHFTGSSSACTPITQANNNDMCANAGDLAIRDYGSSTGEWYRTLQSHDIGAANEVYPP